MRFTTDEKHLIKWIWVKKITQKMLAQDAFDKSWSLDGVKALVKKYQYEIFNFVDRCSGVGIVWSTTTWTRVSDATAVTFSVKFSNSLKLYPETSSESGLLRILNFFLLAFDNNVISRSKSYCCNNTFSDVRFTSHLAKHS